MNSSKNDCLKRQGEPAPSVLYIIGTPIGNLGDLSPRARFLLKNVSIIACEDTRHSGQLVRALGSRSRLVSFHSHNTQKRIPQLLSLLKEGNSLGLISDAGIPGISDPGEELVAKAIKEGLKVIAVPGSCAAITALVSSGFPSSRFTFEGFLPLKNKQRKERLKEIASEKKTSVLYESPHRLIQLLQELCEYCGKERPIHIARELTKLHEEHIHSDISSAIDFFENKKPIGEYTIILGGNVNSDFVDYDDSELLEKMKNLILNGKGTNSAAKEIAEKTGKSKRYLYQIIHDDIQNKSS